MSLFVVLWSRRRRVAVLGLVGGAPAPGPGEGWGKFAGGGTRADGNLAHFTLQRTQLRLETSKETPIDSC